MLVFVPCSTATARQENVKTAQWAVFAFSDGRGEIRRAGLASPALSESPNCCRSAAASRAEGALLQRGGGFDTCLRLFWRAKNSEYHGIIVTGLPSIRPQLAPTHSPPTAPLIVLHQ